MSRISKKKTVERLTDNQEGFAVSWVMNGGNASQAYRDNYSTENMKDTTIWRAAHEVLHNPKVATRINELRRQRFSKRILSIDERKELLSELSLDGDTKALDILNKMEGIYIEKQEILTVGHITMLPQKDKDN